MFSNIILNNNAFSYGKYCLVFISVSDTLLLHLNTGANTNLVCVDIFFCKKCVFMITLCVGALLVSKGVRASSDLGE